jgi:hypothetical protein
LQLILVRDVRSPVRRAGLRSTKSMTLNVDHFTPLSRAVASIDRDSYAARFAIYDREHKALLRRLATADSPCSDADVAREEQAFRDAIRRIEFADEDDQPTLVPQDEPAEEAPPGLRRDPAWQEPPAPRREALDVSILPGLDRLESGIASDHLEPGIAIEPIIRLSEPRSVARRVGERLAIAAVALALVGTGVWLVEARQDQARDPSSLRGAVEPTEAAAADNAADAKSQQPTWLSPEILYAPTIMPPPASPPSALPRADVPLPLPRPER